MSGIPVASPVAGWVVPLSAVPDPVFAERMLGDGLAIDPTEGVVRAPLAGKVVSVHAARHAVTIEADEGPVLLIHIGLETVGLAGEGFVADVAEGARVAAGDVLIRFDLDAVGRRARSLVTPVVLTNGEAFEFVEAHGEGLIAAGEPLFRAVPRGANAVAAVAMAGPLAERNLRIPLRHGLHARPAARLAEIARGHDARVELIAPDGRTAALTSPVAVLALALPHGAEVTLRGQGPEARAAVDAIATLIESGMGEGVELAAEAVPAANDTPLPAELRGVMATSGLAIGPAWRPPDLTAAIPENAADPVAERAALVAARDRVRAALATAAAGEGQAASIAAAHLAFLDDSELLDAAGRDIDAGRSAGFAWQAAMDRFARMLGAAGDRRFAERIDDLRDVARQVLAELAGGGPALEPPAGAILAADEVLPSQLMALAGKGLAGIAAGGGGPTSHAAIIADGLGLPMVVALGADVGRIAVGTPLMLDASGGTLAIDPPADLLTARREAAAREAAWRAAAEARAHEPAVTRDGRRIEVFANLGSLADAQAAVRAGAEGCGLLRTEFVFLDRATPPEEAEQRALYQSIADALEGRPLIVRTLDIGADKPAPWLPMAAEENPALGLRGLRLGLARPELLRTQFRALLGVHGPLRIMLPMVVEPGELAAARALLKEEAASLGRPVPELGVMVETPAAALLAPALAREAAFLSIGSNDLSQYALAIDRGNPAVAAKLDGLHPAVLRLVAATAEGGAAAGRWTGVCGGIAADRAAVPLLIGLGIGELSVPPSQVAAIKAEVRAWDSAACRRLAQRALAADSAAQVRAIVANGVGEEVA